MKRPSRNARRTHAAVEDWIGAPVERRATLVSSLAAVLPRQFVQTGEYGTGRVPLPQLTHVATGTTWIFVPRCRFRMGLSTNEEHAARAIEDPPPLNIEEMRPVHEIDVAPFIVMRTPVDLRLANACLGPTVRRHRPVFPGRGESMPVYLTRGEADRVAATFDAALPTEAQWECACRGGTKTLFFFGDRLPARRRLERLVTTDVEAAVPNPFGLFSLFLGEWCRDGWRPNYASEATDNNFVVRGGASAFWPWQGSEWGFCVSAMRMPSSDLASGLCGVRLVVELGERSGSLAKLTATD